VRRWTRISSVSACASLLHKAVMWGAIPGDIRPLLRMHFILTVRRDSGQLGTHNPVHADTFGGTMCAFALMSTKVPTPFPLSHVYSKCT
jgi:hypothetical protein